MGAMTDPKLPLTVQEYPEWGNPAIAEQQAYMTSYCPYRNIPYGVKLPSILLSSEFLALLQFPCCVFALSPTTILLNVRLR